MATTAIDIADSDIIKLILEFLGSRGFDISMLSLERETGVINGDFSEDALFLRQLILDGQWDDVLDFIKPLAGVHNFDMKEFRYLIVRYKYLELLCLKSEPGPMQQNDFTLEEVVGCLKVLEELCLDKKEFSSLCFLLTLPKLSLHEHYKDWNPSSARMQCFLEVYPLVKAFIPPDPKAQPIAKDNRLLQLLVKGVLHEACVDYCQQKAVGSAASDVCLNVPAVLGDSTPSSDTDLSLLSWLQSIPHGTFSCPFEQKSLKLKVTRLEKPLLDACWSEHILLTPIKPNRFPHSAVPVRTRPAEALTQSLMAQYDGLSYGLHQNGMRPQRLPEKGRGSLLSASHSGAFHLSKRALHRDCMSASVEKLFTAATRASLSGDGRGSGVAHHLVVTGQSGDTLLRQPVGAILSEKMPGNVYVHHADNEIDSTINRRDSAPNRADSTPSRADSTPNRADCVPNKTDSAANRTDSAADRTRSVASASALNHPIVSAALQSVNPPTVAPGLIRSAPRAAWPAGSLSASLLPPATTQMGSLSARLSSELATHSMDSAPSGVTMQTPRDSVGELYSEYQKQKTRIQAQLDEHELLRESMWKQLQAEDSGASPCGTNDDVCASNSNSKAPLADVTEGGLLQLEGICEGVETCDEENSLNRFVSVCTLEDTQAIRAVAFHPSGSFYAVGANSKTLRLCAFPDISRLGKGHNTSAAEVLAKHSKLHKGSIYCLAWSGDGRLIASGSNDHKVKLLSFDASQPNVLGTEVELSMHDGTVRDLTFMSDDSSTLVSGGAGNSSAYVVDCSTGSVVRELMGHSSSILSVHSWSGAKHLFVTGSQDKTARVWDTRAAASILHFASPANVDSAFASVCVEASGRVLASGHEDSSCVLFDVRGGRLLQQWRPHSDEVRCLRFSASGLYLLTTSYDSTVKLADAQGDLTTVLPTVEVARHSDKVIQCRWHPQLLAFVTTSADKTATCWAIPV